LLIEDRDEITKFQDYLKEFDPNGLLFLQLWLTLRGYEKEYDRLLSNLDDANRPKTNFIKWNIKCAKALIQKYFRRVSRRDSRPAQVQEYESKINQEILKTKEKPTIENVKSLRSTLHHLLDVLQIRLEILQFQAFRSYHKRKFKTIKKLKYLPRLPENEVITFNYGKSSLRRKWLYAAV
jgi:hypothetical protein